MRIWQDDGNLYNNFPAPKCCMGSRNGPFDVISSSRVSAFSWRIYLAQTFLIHLQVSVRLCAVTSVTGLSYPTFPAVQSKNAVYLLNFEEQYINGCFTHSTRNRRANHSVVCVTQRTNNHPATTPQAIILLLTRFTSSFL